MINFRIINTMLPARSKITRSALLLAAVVTPLITANAQLTQIFPVTQVWHYDTACHDGDGWETVGFNDSGWLSGPGGFTGGETSSAITPILNTTSLPAPVTLSPAGHAMYFRTHFNVASTNQLSLIMSNAIDDGAVFYLNGSNILNLRVTTPGSCASFSGGAIGPGTEALLWEVHTFTPTNLANIIVPGDNVLAVEVHQVNATSSDMVFGMILMSTTFTSTPPVGPIAFTNGTGVITFDTAPPVQQWSTRIWAGSARSIVDFAGFDAAAKTNDATTITNALFNLTTDPPLETQLGIWSSASGGFICTRPAGVAYSGVMATLLNNSGSAVNQLGIRYTLTVETQGQTNPEQIPGHLVYYSTTGASGSWTQIPELSDAVNDQLAGTYAKSADVTLGSTWSAGTKLYILWVDEAAYPLDPDYANEIDNVQFVTCAPHPPFPPVFLNNTDPTNRTVVQCQSTTFTAGTVIDGCSPAVTYQWYKTDTNHLISGATSLSYTIANVQPADAGVYFVRAANSVGAAESHHATLTVTAPITIQVDPSFQIADLIWPSGVLQWTTNLSLGIGWTDVPGSGNAGLVTSPYTVYWGPGGGSGNANGTNQLFFRLRF